MRCLTCPSMGCLCLSCLSMRCLFVVVLPQNEVLKSVPANCQLPCNILDFVLDVCLKIVMESVQDILKMYAWSLSENQASVKFRCRLIELFLKQLLFRKHDFAIYVYKLYLGSQKSSFWQLKLFPDEKNNFNVQIRENHLNRSKGSYFYGGGQALMFSSEELLQYVSNDLPELQYKFLWYIKICNKQSPVLADDEILCKIPLDVLAPSDMKGNFQMTSKANSETLWSEHIRNGRVQTMCLHLLILPWHGLSKIQCPFCLW